MATKIFKDSKTSDFVVQTSCLDTPTFVAELSEALFDVLKGGDAETAYGILSNAMPIAFKLSGYKSDEVREQRTLVCGNVSPDSSELVAQAGK